MYDSDGLRLATGRLFHIIVIMLLFNGLRCAVLIVDTRKWSMDPV